MPYASWSDVNPSVKGIKPRVTLSQANSIARWADSIGDWAVAMSQFKKLYRAVGGRWVRRAKKVKEMYKLPEAVRKNIEVGTREVGSKTIDPTIEVTFDQVQEIAEHLDELVMNMKPTAELLSWGGKAGKAWATKVISEYYDEVGLVPPHVITFAQLKDQQAAEEQSEGLRELTSNFQSMIHNILWCPETEDKVGAIKSLVDEYASLLDSAKASEAAAETILGTEELIEPELEKERVAESSEGELYNFEVVAEGLDSAPGLVRMDIALIKPGWGNPKDAHYYPKEMLARDAHIFEGAKMYETDHRQTEKSTRTWVSTIEKCPTGFTAEGAPLARVVVHDPDFAQRVRNLNEAGQLSKLESSIMAFAAYRPVKIDGREGKVVESLLEAYDVDWVTKAGAGGHAVNIVENVEGVASMPDEPIIQATESVTEPVVEAKPPSTPTPVIEYLSTERVFEMLRESKLVALAQERVKGRQFTNEADVTTAIEVERKYVSELIGAGRAVDMSSSPTTPRNSKEALAELDTAKNAIVSKWFNRKEK